MIFLVIGCVVFIVIAGLFLQKAINKKHYEIDGYSIDEVQLARKLLIFITVVIIGFAFILLHYALTNM